MSMTKALDNSFLAVDKFDHYIKIASYLAKTEMIPKALRGKPMDIMIIMEMGHQLGMPIMQSIQSIAAINGMPCLYGDGLLALVQSHRDYEWIKETPIMNNNSVVGYTCVVKRRNHEEHTSTFTVNDAKKAGLLNKPGFPNKPGPWILYESRMLQMRARSFALRNIFADALRGVKSGEEISDYREIHDTISVPTMTENDRFLEAIKPITKDDEYGDLTNAEQSDVIRENSENRGK